MDINTNLIYRGDCHSVLKSKFPEKCIDLIYIDPPFSFDPKYARLWYDRETLQMFEEIREGGVKHYIAWMSKRLEQCHRVLKETGSIYLHCDWKFGHYLKIEMDNIFDRNNFVNEIIWAYKTGGASKNKFARKHDTIFLYQKSSKRKFNLQKEKSFMMHKYGFKKSDFEIDSETGLQYTCVHMKDVWNLPAVGSATKERVGYFTQKPEVLLERIIKASSDSEDIVLDPMCGCGTTIAVAHKLGRKWIGIDISSQACTEMKERLENLEGIVEVEVRGLPLTVKDLKELSPFEFQDYICDMTNSVKTQHIADKGIDGYYSGEIPLQIKQRERVGRNVIDEFETALRRKGKNTGYIIAFSFTRNATEEAARAKEDGLSISLIRVDELIRRDYELESLLE